MSKTMTFTCRSIIHVRLPITRAHGFEFEVGFEMNRELELLTKRSGTRFDSVIEKRSGSSPASS
jgi:hypothetical protein